MSPPPVDSVDEFKIASSSYSAEFGSAAGGLDQRRDQSRHQRISRDAVGVLPERQAQHTKFLRAFDADRNQFFDRTSSERRVAVLY